MAAMPSATLLLALLVGVPSLQREDSLEALLERFRARRAELHAELEPRVHELLTDIERLGVSGAESDALRRARDELVALGSECTPLLVGALEPGPDPPAARAFRAQQVARVLAQMDTRAVTADLVVLLAHGSADARIHAARVLGRSEQADRVLPELRQAFATSEGPVRSASLVALARLGVEHSRELFEELLRSDEAADVELALGALTEAPGPAALELVRDFASRPARAAPHARRLIEFYQAARERVGPEDVRSLARLAAEDEVTPLTGANLLETVIALPLQDWPEDLGGLLERVSQSPNRELRDAALVVRALAGDKGARRQLLRERDRLVENNERWADPLVQRAELFYKLRDFGAAIKDYKQALKLAKDDPAPQTEVQVGLARCYARTGKLRDAAGALEDARLSRAKLRELAADPDFAELLGSRYGDVLR